MQCHIHVVLVNQIQIISHNWFSKLVLLTFQEIKTILLQEIELKTACER